MHSINQSDETQRLREDSYGSGFVLNSNKTDIHYRTNAFSTYLWAKQRNWGKVLFQCKIHPPKYICNWHVAITNHREAQKKSPKLSPGTKREAQHKVTSFLQHLVFPSPLWSTFFLWLCWEQSLPTEQLVRGDSYIFWGREANVICSLAGIRTNEKRL